MKVEFEVNEQGKIINHKGLDDILKNGLFEFFGESMSELALDIMQFSEEQRQLYHEKMNEIKKNYFLK